MKLIPFKFRGKRATPPTVSKITVPDTKVVLREAEDITVLRQLLMTRGLDKTVFAGRDANYILPNPFQREQLVQAWCTQDSALQDVRMGVETLNSQDSNAWFAFTSARVAVGLVSRHWKEQLARASITYPDIQECLWTSSETGGVLSIRAESLALEVHFRGMDQETMQAITTFMKGRGAKTNPG